MPGLADNLARVRERMVRAAARAGRPPEAVELVAVTKGCGPDVVRGLWELGLRDFGENRVQEALPKTTLAMPGARWHLIGHLQENKINKVLPWVHLIHSVDSPALGRALDLRAGRRGCRIPVLVEVKTSAETTKHGVAVERALDVCAELAALPGLELRGLMTIAAYEASTAELRKAFATVRRIGEELLRQRTPATVLSMGMSDDFEIAIEEGATMVRLGRALVAG
jgi:pyridoxal phosphate enzyme (YggS family)